VTLKLFREQLGTVSQIRGSAVSKAAAESERPGGDASLGRVVEYRLPARCLLLLSLMTDCVCSVLTVLALARAAAGVMGEQAELSMEAAGSWTSSSSFARSGAC